jgi:hypothetical protein
MNYTSQRCPYNFVYMRSSIVSSVGLQAIVSLDAVMLVLLIEL